MSDKIQYSKTIPINYVVVKEVDVLQLAKFIENLFMPGDFKKGFMVFFDDDSTISGDSIQIFENDEFKRRKTVKIEMEYYSENLDNHLTIELYDTTKYKPVSNIKITSIDSIWYNFTISSISTIVKEIQPQCKLAALDDTSLIGLISTILACSISVFSMLIFSYSFQLASKKLLVVFSCMAMVLSLLFAKIQFDIIKIYPKVSLDFGPQYKNKGQKLKLVWASIISLVLSPVVFMIISLLISK